MRNLNIPITIKEMEFSSLSSYKEHTAPRPSHASRNRCFYSHTKLFREYFCEINVEDVKMLLSKRRTAERGKSQANLKQERGCRNPKNALTEGSPEEQADHRW